MLCENIYIDFPLGGRVPLVIQIDKYSPSFDTKVPQP